MKTESWGCAAELRGAPPSSVMGVLSHFYGRSRTIVVDPADALADYETKRRNGSPGEERGKLPSDGKYSWIKGEVRGDFLYGLKTEKGYEYEVRYDEGPKDRAWMEANDRAYLAHLVKEENLREKEPDVWYLREMDKAQGIDIGEWWSQKLKLPNIGDILERAQKDYQQFVAREEQERAAVEKAKAEAKQQRLLKEKQEQERKRMLEQERQQKLQRPAPSKPLPQPPTKVKTQPTEHSAKTPIDEEGQIKITVTLIPYNKLTFGRSLGEGSFGTVYQGTWQHSDIAVKQLRMTNMSAEALAEFKSEAGIMANLRHPNIIAFYGISVDTPGRYSIVMEYMPEGSLYNLLHNQQPLIWGYRIRIALDITSGLEHLHDKGILHRDLKSLNVLLNSQLRAKLTDFGLSKIKTETITTATTASSQSVGTLPWMAPELFKRRAKYTKSADMYSYGMVLWELASRKVPFADAHNREILIQWIRDGELEDIPEDCPPVFARIIKWCWNQEPAKRPTIEEVANELGQESADQSAHTSTRDHARNNSRNFVSGKP